MASASSDKLKSYREKRDFRRTAEPSDEGSEASGKPGFVIQKHQARTLHYDFRLEADGVLKSWAVPKGPSTDPRTKRLAVPTEDHPLDYADFEGTIPEGEYGAGTVLVWDTGTYQNMKKDEETGEPISMADSLAQGHVIVRLAGKKLQGGYALIRTGRGGDAKWLLIKMRDEHADARRNPTSSEPQSVLSGRTLDEIADEEG